MNLAYINFYQKIQVCQDFLILFSSNGGSDMYKWNRPNAYPKHFKMHIQKLKKVSGRILNGPEYQMIHIFLMTEIS